MMRKFFFHCNAKVDKTLQLEKGAKSQVIFRKLGSPWWSSFHHRGAEDELGVSSRLLSLVLTSHMLWGLVVNVCYAISAEVKFGWTKKDPQVYKERPTLKKRHSFIGKQKDPCFGQLRAYSDAAPTYESWRKVLMLAFSLIENQP